MRFFFLLKSATLPVFIHKPVIGATLFVRCLLENLSGEQVLKREGERGQKQEKALMVFCLFVRLAG